MTWDPITTPVDFALIAGHETPGICVIAGADAEIEWDERKGPFLAGAFLVGGGRNLVKFTLTLTLLTEADWTDWYAFKPVIDRPPAGKRPRSLDVWHPWLVDQGVRSAVVQSIGQPLQLDDGTWQIVIKMIEFRVPKIALVKPEASKPQKSDDPVDKVIENLTAQVQELSK